MTDFPRAPENPPEGVPEWAYRSLARFVNVGLVEQDLLTNLQTSLRMSADLVPLLVEVMDRLDPEISAPIRARWQTIESPTTEFLKVSRAEIAGKFQTLLRLQAVALWASLEVAIEDLVIGYLINDNATLRLPAFSKVKVPIDFFGQSDHERGAHLLRTLESERSMSLKPGVEQFESLLDAIGLGGGVSSETKKSLLELSQVRHVVVHRGAQADARMVQLCPWLGFKVGAEIEISQDDSDRWLQAAGSYAIEVLKRVLDQSQERSSSFGAETT